MTDAPPTAAQPWWVVGIALVIGLEWQEQRMGVAEMGG